MASSYNRMTQKGVRKEPLKHATTWVDLENLENMLSKRRQRRKTCTVLVSFILGAHAGKLTQADSN